MQNQLLTELSKTTTDLLTVIGKFTQEQFNKVPFEGSWTAGQVAEHLFKAESSIPQAWNGDTKATDRPAGEKSGMIKQILLDFDAKLNSPDFLIPSNETKDKEAMYNALKNNRATMESIAAKMDLNLVYTAFEVPGIGALTGEEGLTFVICHSTRHIRQLNNILAAL